YYGFAIEIASIALPLAMTGIEQPRLWRLSVIASESSSAATSPFIRRFGPGRARVTGFLISSP
ncbi:MAG: hypothetical protein ACLFTC_04885, partial [Desulfonatronovibrio sp.]